MATKKQRIRKHVIADLSANHVAYWIYKAGFTVEITHHDYGTDALVATFDSKGYQENGLITLQLKSTDHPDRYKIQGGYSYPIDLGDLLQWNDELYPVYLVLFDAKIEVAYWVEIQSHLKAEGFDPAASKREFHNVRLPKSNVLDLSTPLAWQKKKNEINKRLLKELKK